jgi:hypothetical protein
VASLREDAWRPFPDASRRCEKVFRNPPEIPVLRTLDLQRFLPGHVAIWSLRQIGAAALIF